eukprot:gene8199-biopygen16612
MVILPDLHARACSSTYCGTCTPGLAKADIWLRAVRVPLMRNSRYRALGVACVQRNSRKFQMQRIIGRYDPDMAWESTFRYRRQSALWSVETRPCLRHQRRSRGSADAHCYPQPFPRAGSARKYRLSKGAAGE